MQLSDQRFHNQMDAGQFYDWLQTKKTTFLRLQDIVRTINRATGDIFDPIVQNNPDRAYMRSNQTEWEYHYERVAKALRKLHILNIPTHYRKDGRLYITREECFELGLIYSEKEEQALERVNQHRDKWQAIRREGNKRVEARVEYEAALKYFQDNYSSIRVELKYIGLAGDGMGFVFADSDWLDQF